MLNIQYMLKDSYKKFLAKEELTYQIHSIIIPIKDRGWGGSETLKADVCKYFYNNKEFDNDEFWNNFLENIGDDISENYIMEGYY